MALAPLNLPRLQRGVPIVDNSGKPSGALVRYWNVEFIGALERSFNDQAETLALIQAVQAQQAEQLELILAAQAAAEAAQATADEALAVAGSGSKYIEITGAAEADTAAGSTTATPGVLLSLEGEVVNGTLDANADWVGEVRFSEQLGATTNLLETIPLTITPTGEMLPGPEYVTNPGLFSLSAVGTLSGTITYIVQYVRLSGANFVTDGTITSRLTLTPQAAP